jgi:hypothetical protein
LETISSLFFNYSKENKMKLKSFPKGMDFHYTILFVILLSFVVFAQTSGVTLCNSTGNLTKVVTFNYWVDSSYTVNSTDKTPNGQQFSLDGYVTGDSNNSIGVWYSSTAAHTGGARDTNAYNIYIQTNPNGVWTNCAAFTVRVSGTIVFPTHVITSLGSLYGPAYRFQVVNQTGGSTVTSGNITLVALKKGLRVYGQ